jgi:nitrogen fixation protein FixH
VSKKSQSKEIKGWHVFAVIAGAFSVIIMANMTLAWFAVGTFPGLDVANTYVASQQFNDRRNAQQALGWSIQLSYMDGRIHLAVHDKDGALVRPNTLTLRVGLSAYAGEDQDILLTQTAGGYIADINLPKGNLVLDIMALAEDGTVFSERRRMITR